jgi:hypothetical protein
MNRAAAVDELKKVSVVLASDLEEALALGRENPSQFAHRTLFRTYFSYVEGLAFMLRQVTLASLQETDFLSQGELALLKEERFQLNHRGQPEARENFQQTLPNLLFSIRCYVKNHGSTYQPDIGHHGWECMKRAVAVRDRITHPKSSEGLEITDADAEIFTEGAAWWKRTLLEMFAACGEADEFFRNQVQNPSSHA